MNLALLSTIHLYIVRLFCRTKILSKITVIEMIGNELREKKMNISLKKEASLASNCSKFNHHYRGMCRCYHYSHLFALSLSVLRYAFSFAVTLGIDRATSFDVTTVVVSDTRYKQCANISCVNVFDRSIRALAREGKKRKRGREYLEIRGVENTSGALTYVRYVTYGRPYVYRQEHRAVPQRRRKRVERGI